MAHEAVRDVIVAGASAGGIEALCAFVGNLPEDLPAAVLVVLHQPAGGTGALPRILARSGPLPAVAAKDGMTLQPGYLQLAPPDRHLLVADDHLRLSHGPTENGHRPSVDVLFRSAARALGPRVIGIVFSGVLGDGTAGMVSVASRGGLTIVQDPGEALYSGMPENVLRRLTPDYVLAAAEISKVVVERLGEPVGADGVPPLSPLELLDARLAEHGDADAEHEVAQQGALVELAPGGGRYRCRVGHVWTANALLDAQSGTLANGAALSEEPR